MISSEVQRTLVKSPPVLWSELSDPQSLARHRGELGDIRITHVEPERLVAWEAQGTTGQIQIRASAWATKVTLSGSRELPALARAQEQPEPEAGAPRERETTPAPATEAAPRAAGWPSGPGGQGSAVEIPVRATEVAQETPTSAAALSARLPSCRAWPPGRLRSRRTRQASNLPLRPGLSPRGLPRGRPAAASSPASSADAAGRACPHRPSLRLSPKRSRWTSRSPSRRAGPADGRAGPPGRRAPPAFLAGLDEPRPWPTVSLGCAGGFRGQRRCSSRLRCGVCAARLGMPDRFTGRSASWRSSPSPVEPAPGGRPSPAVLGPEGLPATPHEGPVHLQRGIRERPGAWRLRAAARPGSVPGCGTRPSRAGPGGQHRSVRGVRDGTLARRDGP